MGRADPEIVASQNVPGGNSSKIDVTFMTPMGSYCQDPVTYEGDLDALGPNPPGACPFPPSPTEVTQTCFFVPTVQVTDIKKITVIVRGPEITKKSTFTVYPTL